MPFNNCTDLPFVCDPSNESGSTDHLLLVLHNQNLNSTLLGGCPRGVMVKAMDSGIVVREFVLQLHYYIHFQANTLGKGMNPLILLAMG